MNTKTVPPVIKIIEFNIDESILNISLKVTCPAELHVHSPKVKVIFECEEEDRRLPLDVEASYPSNDLKNIIIYANYRYYLDYLFNTMEPGAKITVRFAVVYGDNYYESPPFSLSREISFDSKKYHVTVDKVKGFFTIEDISLKNQENIGEKHNIQLISAVMKRFVKIIYQLVLYLLGFLLLPLFILDALLSKLDISPVSKLNHSTGLKWYLSHIRWRYSSFCKQNLSILGLKEWYFKTLYLYYSNKYVVKNRISFLSSRRDDMSGNLGFVHALIKKEAGSYDIQELLDPSPLLQMSYRNIRKLSYLCATSKILLIDDFFPILSLIGLKDETKLIQLWHACGAFKTFGFTRLGKRGGPLQTSRNHRNYDYAIVSSQEIAKYYAEGFGIPTSHVIATGVPRTDIFFNDTYKNKIVEQFYNNYPKLKGKKIILFAPTFRGNGKETAYYPPKQFDPVRVYESTNQEYAIIIKHHPFVKDKPVIPEEYQDCIIDLSEQSELNDLLFVTDVVITDYSSLIFEASLLNIPMLFYAYDLRRYIATRDFYYEYELFVPGKIVSSQAQLIDAINQRNYEADKIGEFKKRFFDHQDGHSTERVVQLMKDIINQQ